jgi:hypothetical protein
VLFVEMSVVQSSYRLLQVQFPLESFVQQPLLTSLSSISFSSRIEMSLFVVLVEAFSLHVPGKGKAREAR